jgi:hypothetical protein
MGYPNWQYIGDDVYRGLNSESTSFLGDAHDRNRTDEKECNLGGTVIASLGGPSDKKEGTKEA